MLFTQQPEKSSLLDFTKIFMSSLKLSGTMLICFVFSLSFVKPIISNACDLEDFNSYRFEECLAHFEGLVVSADRLHFSVERRSLISFDDVFKKLDNNASIVHDPKEMLVAEIITSGCTDPTAHNYDQMATEDDGSCETCNDGILNGDEEAVDCGGMNCTSCLTVTNTDLEGQGSLAAAINFANVHPLADSIVFDIAGDGPHIIQLNNDISTLPVIMDPGIIIDGSTQPSYDLMPIEIISRSTGFGFGLKVGAFTEGVGIYGLKFIDFGAGIECVSGFPSGNDWHFYVGDLGRGNIFDNCFQGITITGGSTASQGSATIKSNIIKRPIAAVNNRGILVQTDGNIIGGDMPEEGNFISNYGKGVCLCSTAQQNNTVTGNTFVCVNTPIELAVGSSPTIDNATTSLISGTAIANTAVDVYTSGECTGTCKDYIYQGTVLADAMGEWSLSVSGLLPGMSASATQNDISGDGTSPFADCVTLTEGTPCDDGIQNGDEEGIDCGGLLCEPCATGGEPLFWINEIHYDNSGSDINEFVEVAGPAGENAEGLEIYFVNGNNGSIYNNMAIDGVFPASGIGYGAIAVYQSGIQNGAPDGVALFYNSELVEAIAYEGTFVGASGLVNGVEFVDIGVSETSSTPSTHSLQKTGTGCPLQMEWIGPATHSAGLLNDAQNIEACLEEDDSCDDGIQNNGELAIDCGGEFCSPCDSISVRLAIVNDPLPVCLLENDTIETTLSVIMPGPPFIPKDTILPSYVTIEVLFSDRIEGWLTDGNADFTLINTTDSSILIQNIVPLKSTGNHSFTIKYFGNDASVCDDSESIASQLYVQEPYHNIMSNFYFAQSFGLEALPTCDDGIQNGDEEGIDCGGENCPQCMTTMTYNVPDSSIIADANVFLDIFGNDGNQVFFEAKVTSPQGTDVILYPYGVLGCGNQIYFTADDEGVGGLLCPNFTTGVNANPSSLFGLVDSTYVPLSIFDGENAQGDWILTITGPAYAMGFGVIIEEEQEILGCTDPSAHNYDPMATSDDGTCETCTDEVQNGDEVGIDCGGTLCSECDSIGINLGIVAQSSTNCIDVGESYSYDMTVNRYIYVPSVPPSGHIGFRIGVTTGLGLSNFSSQDYEITYQDDTTLIIANIDPFLNSTQTFFNFDIIGLDGQVCNDQEFLQITEFFTLPYYYNNSNLIIWGGPVGVQTIETCTDGIQNGDETGVDCGGILCEPCMNSCDHPDFEALLSFYTSLGGDNWTIKTGWEDGAMGLDCEPCNWYGITCDQNNRVSCIDFDGTNNCASNGNGGNNLSGTIPESVSQLSHLTTLNLANNTISGPIPESIGGLSNLINLDLSGCDIGGVLPDSLGSLNNLVRLYIDGNDFTGSIPSSYGNLTSLIFMQIRASQISGPIPSSFQNLTNLKFLRLNNNNLEGSLPDELFLAPELIEVRLDNNNITGTIPSTIGDAENLNEINLGSNDLSGCFHANLIAICSDQFYFGNNPLLPGGGDFDAFCLDGTGGCTSPTCDDGIQNGDEEGIDCGGMLCDPCIVDCASPVVLLNEMSIEGFGLEAGCFVPLEELVLPIPQVISSECPLIDTVYSFSVDGVIFDENVTEFYEGTSYGKIDVINDQLDTTSVYYDIYITCEMMPMPGCTDPGAHNFDPIALEDDGSCETCDDGIQNGDEEGVDCGGMLCEPCNQAIVLDYAISCQENITQIYITYVEGAQPGDCILELFNYVPYSFGGTEDSGDTVFVVEYNDVGPNNPADVFIFSCDLSDEILTESIIDICPTCTDGIQNGDETGIDCGGQDCEQCDLYICDIGGIYFDGDAVFDPEFPENSMPCPINNNQIYAGQSLGLYLEATVAGGPYSGVINGDTLTNLYPYESTIEPLMLFSATSFIAPDSAMAAWTLNLDTLWANDQSCIVDYAFPVSQTYEVFKPSFSISEVCEQVSSVDVINEGTWIIGSEIVFSVGINGTFDEDTVFISSGLAVGDILTTLDVVVNPSDVLDISVFHCQNSILGGPISLSAECSATCTDGIQNGDETGIDCGGMNCEPCCEVDLTCLLMADTLYLDSQTEMVYVDTFKYIDVVSTGCDYNIYLSQTAFDCDDLGESTLYLNVTDDNGSGTSLECEVQINVIDQAVPIISGPTEALEVEAMNTECFVTSSEIDLPVPIVIFENCIVEDTTYAFYELVNDQLVLSGDTLYEGVNFASIIVTDNSGNQSEYFYDIIVSCGFCQEPEGLTVAPQPSFVNLSWLSTDADHYNVYAVEQGLDPYTEGTLFGPLMDTFTTVGAILTEGITYDWYVEAICGDESSDLAQGDPFTFSVTSLDFSYNVNFEAGLVYPSTGLPSETYRFEATYSNQFGILPEAGSPRIFIDRNGNGSFNSGDMYLTMSEIDETDMDVTDGKQYYVEIAGLSQGYAYQVTAQDIKANGYLTSFGPFDNPDVLEPTDISIFASDISFSDPTPEVSTMITVSATIHNFSSFDAEGFSATLFSEYDETTYPAVENITLVAGGSTTVSWNVMTPPDVAFVPMRVFVDSDDILMEPNELDNNAVRPYVNGEYNFAADGISMEASASLSANSNGTTILSGNAYYLGLEELLDDDAVVGGQVIFTVSSTEESYVTTTDGNGNFSFDFPTPNEGYQVTGSVTDFTLTATFEANPCLADLSGYIYRAPGVIRVAGEVYSFNMTVENDGCLATLDSVLVSYDLPESDSTGMSFMVPPLVPGESYSKPFAASYATQGTKFVPFDIDIDEVVVESSEANNSGTSQFNIYCPAPSILHNGAPTAIGNPDICGAAYRVHLRNYGGVASGAFTSLVTLTNEQGDSLAQLIPFSSIGALSNASRVVVFNGVENTGDHTLTIYFDYYDEVEACSEAFQHVIFDGYEIDDCGDDLFVQGCTSIDVTSEDGTSTLTATYVSTGDTDITTNIPISIVVGGILYQSEIVGGLSNGASHTETWVVSTPPAEDAGFTLFVDNLDSIPELNENNNSYSSSLGYDFVPSELCYPYNTMFWENDYLPFQPISMNIGLYNYGHLTTDGVQVRFEVVSGPGVSEPYTIGTSVTNDLGYTCGCPRYVGLTNSPSFNHEGTYQIRITADPLDGYAETDETNNQMIVSLDIVSDPDYSSASEFINPSLLNPELDEEITFDVTYRNTGQTDQTPFDIQLRVDNVVHQTKTVSGLVSGDFATVNFDTPWSSDVQGAHVVTVYVDHLEEIQETNELNNSASRIILVGQAPNGRFTNFSTDNDNPQVGDQIMINGTVANLGDVDATMEVDLYYYDNAGDSIYITSTSLTVLANSDISFTQPWIVTDASTTVLGVIRDVDPIEYDLTDNEATFELNGFDIELQIVNVVCADDQTGSATAMTIGGTAPYTYAWSSGGTTSVEADLGKGMYTVTVTDADNRLAIREFEIIVTDEIAPTVTCSDITGYLDENGQYILKALTAGVSATDNCPVGLEGLDIQFNQTIFTCADLGNNIITATAIDNQGNEGTCFFNLMVLDTLAPTITCHPFENVIVGDLGSDCFYYGSGLDPVVQDNCEFTLTNSIDGTSSLDGYAFELGFYTITWIVTDLSGNSTSCAIQLVVQDNMSPTISCPEDLVVSPEDLTSCTWSGDLGMPVADDNCIGIAVTNDAPAEFGLGFHLVTWTVTDDYGNTSECTQSVDVQYMIEPIVDCGVDTVLYVGSTCSLDNVQLPIPSVQTCNGYTVTNDLPYTLTPGDYTVVWTVEDDLGFTAECSVLVTVIDDVDPVITCTNEVVVNTDPGSCEASEVVLPSIIAQDDCGIASITSNELSSYPLDTTTVTYEVTDVNGNSSTCEVLVIVIDNETPEIACAQVPQIITITPDVTEYIVPDSTWDAMFADNCNEAFITNDYNAAATLNGEGFEPGNYTITWTVDDNHGNTSMCSYDFEVIVQLFGCTDPDAHNYEPLATDDDGSCETCDDGIQNGDETGVDCGGALCDECPVGDFYITSESVSNDDVLVGEAVSLGSYQRYTGDYPTTLYPRLGYFLSNDDEWDSSDIAFDQDDVSTIYAGDLSDFESATVTIPDVAEGEYYILFVSDYENTYLETAEGNNVNAIMINISEEELVPDDFYTDDATLSQTIVAEGSTITVSVDQYYSGVSTATLIPQLGYYLSEDATLSNDDELLATDVSTLSINDIFDPESASLSLAGVDPGDYYILFVANHAELDTESDISNNTAALSITIIEDAGGSTEDIYISNTSLTISTLNAGEVTRAKCRQYYAGSGTGNASVHMKYYLSVDTELDASDIQLASDASSIGTSDSWDTESAYMTIPSNTAGGNYYILFSADDPDGVDEYDEDNNVEYLPLTVLGSSSTISSEDIELDAAAFDNEEQMDDYGIDVRQNHEEVGDVSVYPNPSTGVINLGGNTQNILSISLYKGDGNKVSTFDSSVGRLDLSERSAGLYILRIKMNNGSIITKRIILI